MNPLCEHCGALLKTASEEGRSRQSASREAVALCLCFCASYCQLWDSRALLHSSLRGLSSHKSLKHTNRPIYTTAYLTLVQPGLSPVQQNLSSERPKYVTKASESVIGCQLFVSKSWIWRAFTKFLVSECVPFSSRSKRKQQAFTLTVCVCVPCTVDFLVQTLYHAQQKTKEHWKLCRPTWFVFINLNITKVNENIALDEVRNHLENGIIALRMSLCKNN